MLEEVLATTTFGATGAYGVVETTVVLDLVGEAAYTQQAMMPMTQATRQMKESTLHDHNDNNEYCLQPFILFMSTTGVPEVLKTFRCFRVV